MEMGKMCLAVTAAALIVCAGPLRAGGAEYEGLIEPSEVIELSSQISGVLEEVAVERGDRVSRGQVLARLHSGVEKAQVELARARLEFKHRTSARSEELFSKELISLDERDQLLTEIEIAGLDLREAEERLAMRSIKSPAAGVVTSRLLAPGEYIGEGHILTIACIDPLNVEVIVPAGHYGRIKKGQTATVRPETPVGGSYPARVIIVDQVIDAASTTYGVRLSLANPDRAIPAGLRCTVVFQD